MRLTVFTDYTLRTLIYLAGQRDHLATVADIADMHNISRHHLTKVVYQLALTGAVRTVRGRHGGIALARAPSAINIGSVVRASEPDFHMAACFDKARAVCPYARCCGIQAVLGRATRAYLAELDAVTLADLIVPVAPPDQYTIKEIKMKKSPGALSCL